MSQLAIPYFDFRKTHRGLMTSHGVKYQGSRWFRYWLSPVRSPVITWSNSELAIIAPKEHVNEGGIKISLQKMLPKIPLQNKYVRWLCDYTPFCYNTAFGSKKCYSFTLIHFTTRQEYRFCPGKNDWMIVPFKGEYLLWKYYLKLAAIMHLHFLCSKFKEVLSFNYCAVMIIIIIIITIIIMLKCSIFHWSLCQVVF